MSRPSERSKRNLKRGAASPEALARARAAKAQYRADEERLGEKAREDPEGVLLDLHSTLSKGVLRLTRKWLASDRDPSRQLTDAWRELRMLSERVLELLRARGEERQVGAFFDTLDARLETVAEVLRTAEHPFPPPDELLAEPG